MAMLQAGCEGVQIWGSHRKAAPLQNWVDVQVWMTLELSPFMLHWRSSLPEQNCVPAVHTTGLHAAAMQTCPFAPQSSVTCCVKPSAEQVKTFSPVQPVTNGEQTQGTQLAALFCTWQVCPVMQDTGARVPLPSALQETIAFLLQVEVPAAHMSGAHFPD
jgi:hypothetical protein